MCICVSVKSNLTFGASVRPKNAVRYSEEDEPQNGGIFSETTPLQRYNTYSVHRHTYRLEFLSVHGYERLGKLFEPTICTLMFWYFLILFCFRSSRFVLLHLLQIQLKDFPEQTSAPYSRLLNLRLVHRHMHKSNK